MKRKIMSKNYLFETIVLHRYESQLFLLVKNSKK